MSHEATAMSCSTAVFRQCRILSICPPVLSVSPFIDHVDIVHMVCPAARNDADRACVPSAPSVEAKDSSRKSSLCPSSGIVIDRWDYATGW